ncbi:uncharacterized [Tachysurus ichikawai]
MGLAWGVANVIMPVTSTMEEKLLVLEAFVLGLTFSIPLTTYTTTRVYRVNKMRVFHPKLFSNTLATHQQQKRHVTVLRFSEL